MRRSRRGSARSPRASRLGVPATLRVDDPLVEVGRADRATLDRAGREAGAVGGQAAPPGSRAPPGCRAVGEHRLADRRARPGRGRRRRRPCRARPPSGPRPAPRGDGVRAQVRRRRLRAARRTRAARGNASTREGFGRRRAHARGPPCRSIGRSCLGRRKFRARLRSGVHGSIGPPGGEIARYPCATLVPRPSEWVRRRSFFCRDRFGPAPSDQRSRWLAETFESP